MKNNSVLNKRENRTISSKRKIEKRIKKVQESELNKWVKSLPRPQKRLFFKRLYNNELLWGSKSVETRISNFNNYRYRTHPNDIDALLIYTSAKHTDPSLKLKTIFPYISEHRADLLMPSLLKESLETENFSIKNN